MSENTLTEEQAAEMLRQLTKHYCEPVMPISRYCNALRTWQKCLVERADTDRCRLYPGIYSEDANIREAAWALFQEERKNPPEDRTRLHALDMLKMFDHQADQVAHVFSSITKSSLLDRLLYCGEKLRTGRCPVHDGTWSGLEFSEETVCPHRCHLTGWIFEE